MKIGIFGDSFGDDYNLWPNPYDGVGPSWIDHIRSFSYEVENFSCGGTSLFYSYELFLKNYKKYDKIIFLITSHNRIEINIDEFSRHWFNGDQVLNELRECRDVNKRSKLKAIFNYYAYISDYDYDIFAHKLLIQDIADKHNSILLIPCFENSGINDKMPLLDISRYEAEYWKMPNGNVLPNSKETYDARKCHMCEENSLIFGEKVKDWIDTGIYNLTKEDLTIPSKDFNHYFRKDFRLLIKK